MDFRDLSKPSDGDRHRPRKKPSAEVRKRTRTKKRRSQLEKEVRHEINAAAHRGDMMGYDYLCDLCQYAFGALGITRPYNKDRTPREGVTPALKEEHFRWQGIMRDLLALRLPLEKPRLAAVTFREERRDDNEEYATVWEMEARCIKDGIPVQRLIQIERKRPANAGAGPNDGVAG